MTDEEMAEEYASSSTSDRGYYYEGLKEGFLDGLKAGRPKWHKVADGDLPKDEAEYLVIFESDRTRYTGLEIYYPDTEEWSTICNIIAWCEIPKFEETE